ncbi:MAG: class I SAM-dependent methyltransferase [Acidobacteriota bacterium]
MQKVSAGLGGVPETMLWTLHHRAAEAMRQDRIFEDPKAIEIYRSIDYDYRRNFGRPQRFLGVRSAAFDSEIERFLGRHPDAVIVNLGEGLETHRYRVVGGDALWITVDLPESIAIRERFIKPDEAHVHLPKSALDRSWLEHVPAKRPVLVTAQGLFMYLPKDAVRALLVDVLGAFERCQIVFDTVPRWFSRRTRSKLGLRMTPYYRVPEMPWGINRNEIGRTLGGWLGREVAVGDVGYPTFPRGFERLLTRAWFSGPLSHLSPTIVRIKAV